MKKPTVKEFENGINALIVKMDFATADQIRASIYRQTKRLIDGSAVVALCQKTLAENNKRYDLASYGA